jgi:hypothetical protein
MPDLFDNPMGLMGFEFVEFASPTPKLLEPLFEKMGFSLVARHRCTARATSTSSSTASPRAWPATSRPSTGRARVRWPFG